MLRFTINQADIKSTISVQCQVEQDEDDDNEMLIFTVKFSSMFKFPYDEVQAMFARDQTSPRADTSQLNRSGLSFILSMSKQICEKLHGDMQVDKQSSEDQENDDLYLFTFSFRCTTSKS